MWRYDYLLYNSSLYNKFLDMFMYVFLPNTVIILKNSKDSIIASNLV